jgi:hypothetical protein
LQLGLFGEDTLDLRASQVCRYCRAAYDAFNKAGEVLLIQGTTSIAVWAGIEHWKIRRVRLVQQDFRWNMISRARLCTAVDTHSD